MITKDEKRLFEKYNQPIPRYTSFPSYPNWNGDISQEKWLNSIRNEYDPESGADIYIHIPYCDSPCLYCGCNKKVTKNHQVELPLLEALKKEWSTYVREISDFKASTIHLGGGTPTFLSPENLDNLLTYITSDKKTSGSIEVDPRVTTIDHLKVLRKHGFNRISMGIQDFSPLVQKAINRIQPFEMVEDLVKQARDLGFDSVNFDLIYGLPLQSEETIKETIYQVCKIKPNTIAFYSYAHLPSKFKGQKSLEKYGLLEGIEKYDLFLIGREKLLETYKELGMDHFTLEDDPLYESYKKGELKRTFMGYTSWKSNILIGLGPSSISNSETYFVQNEKDINSYQESLKERDLALSSGHQLSEDDLHLSKTIEDIMCNGKADINHLLLNMNRKYGLWVRPRLDKLIQDDLFLLESGNLKVREKGRHFLRNICFALDSYMDRDKSVHGYSKSL